MAELGNQNKVSEMLLCADWGEQMMRFRDWGAASSLHLGSSEVLESMLSAQLPAGSFTEQDTNLWCHFLLRAKSGSGNRKDPAPLLTGRSREKPDWLLRPKRQKHLP